MKRGAHVVATAVARLYTPLALVFAFTIIAMRAPGAGVGFVAGLAFALALLLHALVFGAAAAKAAFPPLASRLVMALGLGVALSGAGAPRLPYAPQLIEAGLFAVTIAAASLMIAALFGRLPTLRDAEW